MGTIDSKQHLLRNNKQTKFKDFLETEDETKEPFRDEVWVWGNMKLSFRFSIFFSRIYFFQILNFMCYIYTAGICTQFFLNFRTLRDSDVRKGGKKCLTHI